MAFRRSPERYDALRGHRNVPGFDVKKTAVVWKNLMLACYSAVPWVKSTSLMLLLLVRFIAPMELPRVMLESPPAMLESPPCESGRAITCTSSKLSNLK